MRPSGSTPVASTITSPKPPSAKRPRCTRCQSLARPCFAEYWHIGETTVRFLKMVPRRVKGENSLDIGARGVRRKNPQNASDLFHRQVPMEDDCCALAWEGGKALPLTAGCGSLHRPRSTECGGTRAGGAAFAPAG